MEPKTVGERVVVARERKGWTQSELARQASITRAAVHQLEHGLTKVPTPGNLFAIAEATGVSPKWLLDGKGLPEGVRPVAAGEGLGRIAIPHSLPGN